MKWPYTMLTLTVLSALFSAPLNAADVTITVNGRVVAKPCTVATKNANVALGDLYTQNLQSAGAASAWHSVDLKLTDCPAGTSRVTATLNGEIDSTGYFKNQGTAGSIQLQLQDDSGTTLNSGDSKTVNVDEAAQTAIFPFKVRALTVNGSATQGSVDALINVVYTWQ